MSSPFFLSLNRIREGYRSYFKDYQTSTYLTILSTSLALCFVIYLTVSECNKRNKQKISKKALHLSREILYFDLSVYGSNQPSKFVRRDSIDLIQLTFDNYEAGLSNRLPVPFKYRGVFDEDTRKYFLEKNDGIVHKVMDNKLSHHFNTGRKGKLNQVGYFQRNGDWERVHGSNGKVLSQPRMRLPIRFLKWNGS